MCGADLRKSASALAAARKQWRVGLVPRPYGLSKGREPPHLPWQKLVIVMILHSNSFKKVPRVLLPYTIRATICGQELAQSGQVGHKSGQE